MTVAPSKISPPGDLRRQKTCCENKGMASVLTVAVMAILSILSSSSLTADFDDNGAIRFDAVANRSSMMLQNVQNETLLSSNNQENLPEELQTVHSREMTRDASAFKDVSSEIQVILPSKQIEWMKNRTAHFNSFYEIPFDQGVDEKLHMPADNLGPVLDFLVAGFPKCGTTTMMANLASLAPMPMEQDVCTPPRRTVLYAYKNWPKKYGQLKHNNDSTVTTISNSGKLFRSSKCPMFIEEGWVEEISQFLPKTKLIVGIRHPIEWFLSFWKMQDSNSPYESLGMCPCNVGEQRPKCKAPCRGRCPADQLYCLGRARFHLALARLGKTALTTEERQWLAPNDSDGGDAFISYNITNWIFLYDQTQLRQGESLWIELAKYLGVSHIPHARFKGSVGRGKNYTLCDPTYDDFRAKMMPYSYELSVWLQKFFLPIARDASRADVFVADVDNFTAIIKNYALDPCQRLIRMDNGTYILNASFFGN